MNPATLAAPWALWQAAGEPLHPECEPYAGRCWWCGYPAPGKGRPVRLAIAETFPDAKLARQPTATHVCAPCGWTLSERCLALPADYAAARVANLCAQGRRAQVSLRGAPAARYLVLSLADGRIGLWRPELNAAAEAPWQEAREALRSAPSSVGPCDLLEIVAPGDIRADATEIFRSYHHTIGRDGRWQVATDSDKPVLRELLLSPPQGSPWACVIGDGQKHAALYAPACVPAPGLPVAAFLQGRTVHYHPERLGALLEGVEALSVAGVSEEEIRADAYHPRPAALLTVRRWRPLLSPLRYSGLLDLALYLRRPVAVLRDSAPGPHIPAPAPPPVAPSPRPPLPPVGAQMRLFG